MKVKERASRLKAMKLGFLVVVAAAFGGCQASRPSDAGTVVTQPDDVVPVGNIGEMGPLPGVGAPAPAASTPAVGAPAATPVTELMGPVATPITPGAPAAPVSGIGLDDATCGAFTPPRAAVLTPIAPELPGLLNSMTLSQKVDALHGGPCCNVNFDCNFNGMDSGSFLDTGLPTFKMRDGPRGVHGLDGEIATTWAVAMARAASFDLNMEERVGQLQGVEMQALNHDLSLAPTVNTLRHPGWARAQETYGEDPVLLGEMGAAFVRGMQQTTPSCVKHFAVNNTDENRRIVSSNLDEQTLRENYTRAFKIVIEKSDPACVMAAYNLVNGTPSTQNSHLLTDILREDWGWTGFVLSDWWSTTANQGQAVMNAGLDLEMPDDCAFNVLDGAVLDGSVQSNRINQAAERILNVRQKFGQLDPAYRNKPFNAGISSTPAHQLLALETSEKGTVLLQNDGVLPIAAGTAVAILGPDAHLPSQIDENQTAGPPDGLGDRGSSEVNEPYAISIAAGMQEAGAVVTVGREPADAAGADVVVIPVTMQHLDEGEAFGGGGDRDDLTLSGQHPLHWTGTTPAAFIGQVAAVNPNIVVVLMVGSAIVQEEWMGQARAIVQPFYPGQEGGRAIARLLTGRVNFSAKLPFTVAQSAASYPAFSNLGSQAAMDYLHGYRKFEAEQLPVRYWFGHGLSYTTYEYSKPTVLCSQVSASGRVNVEVTVTNTGTTAGDEIVQLYIGYPNTQVRRPVKELKAFTRVSLAPGASQTVQLSVPASDMAYYDMATDGWVIETGLEHSVIVAPNANPMYNATHSAPFTISQ